MGRIEARNEKLRVALAFLIGVFLTLVLVNFASNTGLVSDNFCGNMMRMHDRMHGTNYSGTSYWNVALGGIVLAVIAYLVFVLVSKE